MASSLGDGFRGRHRCAHARMERIRGRVRATHGELRHRPIRSAPSSPSSSSRQRSRFADREETPRVGAPTDLPGSSDRFDLHPTPFGLDPRLGSASRPIGTRSAMEPRDVQPISRERREAFGLRHATVAMAMATTVATCMAAGVALGMAWIATKTLKSRRENLGGAHATFAVVVAVSVVALVLLPADADHVVARAYVHVAYRAIYLLLLVLSLVVAPFHYLVREDAEEGRGARRDRCGRTPQAVGLTVAYLLLLGVLLAVTLYAWKGGTKEGVRLVPDPGELLRWTIVWTTLMGVAVVLAYATHGLVALPHGLVFGSKGVQGQIEELEEYLKVMQKRIDELELHAMNEDNLDVSHTERELLHLQGREQIITRKINRLRESAYLGWCQRFVMSATIFLKRLLGIVLAVATLVIVVSCFTSAVGTSARVTDSDIVTPLDRILGTTLLHQEAPPLVLAFVLLYLFCAFLEGMTTFGIHIIWVKLYAVQPGHTLSEALLLLSVMMAFPIYGTAGLMLNIAPHYTRYGAQPGCAEGVCKETEIFKIIVLLRQTFPYMQDVFYYAGTWGFGVITILWCGGLLVGNSCRAWQDQRALVTDEEEPLL